MDSASRARSADLTILPPRRRRGGPSRPLLAGFFVFLLVFLAWALGPRAASAQSCAGKAAGDVCRPSAGACDIAESCAATGGNPGVSMYQPTGGTLFTNSAWNFNMGYAFTPNKTITVTSLGGYFNGTRTVSLYDRTTGAVIASATVTSANGWAYAPITPITLTKLAPYSVAVYLAGSGGAYRSGMPSMPTVLADATIDGSCYRSGSTAEPCASSGLVPNINYGMADIKYLPAAGLYQPTDGTLYTEVAGDYNAGYAFTPNKNLTLTSLGGFFNGTRTVYLYNRSTGALLASAPVTSANGWVYTRISPTITLTAGTSYTVSVYLPGTGGAYRGGMASMPSALADATLEGTCYRPSSTAEPCASSGLIAGTNYGMADIKYTATGGALACPADVLAPAGNVCRSASGSCDLAETCTGSSAACPANGFVPSGVSCSDGALCTFNDVCNGAGSCGGTAITCGGGNACSTTQCNGTSTCEVAKVFCNDPPGECYNTLGTCNTGNGSCSYTVKTGAPCGSRGTCQSSGACYTPPPVAGQGIPEDCATQTIPVPTPIGCDSCDPSRPCLVDTTITVPVEYQTCSGYTPRKGDIVLHEARGLTQALLKNFGTQWTHVGVFLDPQPPGANQQKQLVRHEALNLDGLSQSVIQPGILSTALIALSLNKNSAYCKSAKLNPTTLFDAGQFIPGVPNSHTGDMVTELDGNGTLFWEDGVVDRQVVLAANRSAGESVANGMLARNDYYSLNSLLDEAKGRATLSNGKPGTNCASAIMSCITPAVPPTVLTTDKIRNASEFAYELIRQTIKNMQKTKDSINLCKQVFCPLGTFLCPVDCNGLAWETANGIADQVIACILFGPTAGGCECTRDNRKWHYAAWAGSAAVPPTQDEDDWVHGRMTDIEFIQDPWTGPAAQGTPQVTIYPSSTYLPADVMRAANYPSGSAYYLKKVANATRKYGHCRVPLTVIVTPSPSSSPAGTAITWTATATGGTPSTTRFAFFRRPSGTTPWIPPVTAPAWQISNTFTWTPASNETGNWDIYVWVKDGDTPSNAHTYGYEDGTNPGGVAVTSGGVVQIYPAKGWVDGYNTQHIWGWACDPDYPTQSNRVDVYTTSGQGLGSSGAFGTSSSGINSQCLGGTAHYFDFYPSGGIPSGTHFNVWSIDLPYATAGNDNRKTGGTGSIGDGTEFVIP